MLVRGTLCKPPLAQSRPRKQSATLPNTVGIRCSAAGARLMLQPASARTSVSEPAAANARCAFP